WGGGTPSYLSEGQIQRLFNKIQSLFDIDFNEEIAIEVDPRTVPLSKLKVLRELGFNRISLGVQDFDEKVKDDINSIQPFEQNKFNLEAIPLHDEKIDIFVNSRNTLLSNDYQAIAMDHFALKSDEMAKAFNEGRLYRNFMGYTVKPADEFIGMGPSAIGFLEN